MPEEVGQPSAAPAQPAASPNPVPDQGGAPAAPSTAVEAAVASKDFSAYRDAKRAEASGKPLPAPAPAAPVPPAEPRVSNRQRQINDYERTIAEQNAELTRLRAGGAPAAPPAAARSADPATPAPAQAPANDPEPTPDKFANYELYVKAQARWEAREELRTQAAATHTRDAQARQAQTEHTRRTKFSESMQATTTADPTFLERVSPDVLALKPFAALAPGEQGGPLNAIAEELIDSDVAPQLMLHLSQHPEELRRLATLAPRALIREFGRLEARLAKPATDAPSTPTPKTVPSAPPPPATLGARGSDPTNAVDSALKRKDFSAFRAAKRAGAAR